MCGIAGAWIPSRPELTGLEALSEMVALLRHRGPDGQGYHIDTDRGLGMGHARLSINDLKGGDQPIKSHDENLILTANGEFYEFKQRRAALATLGEQFRTKSDNELALAYYSRRGLDFVEELRGEFAFALFDAKHERLILVRDRFGVRPLFFAQAAGGIVYASEIKAILAHPAVSRRFSRRAALHQMMQTMVPGDTLFEGVHALRPGHMLIVQKGPDGSLQVEDRTYWDMEFPEAGQHQQPRSPEDAVAEVRDVLIDSIRVRLEADVTVGAYVSGGIDSCCILGIAAAIKQDPVKAFTIAFDDNAFDESKIAIEMARSINAEHDLLLVTEEDLYGENYEAALWHSERTFYNTLGVAKYCLSRRVYESGIKVVVTGEGSDELFGGYPFFRRDLNRIGQGKDPDALFSGALLAAEEVRHPAFEALCGFTPAWIQNWLTTLEMARPLLGEAAKRELADYDPGEAIATSFDRSAIEGRHPLDISQYTWIKTMLEGQILNWGGDRVDMANSLESRPAFLDHELAKVAARIPPELRIRGETEKWVLREAVRGVLPETLYRRRKFPFMAPPAHTDPKKRAALEQLIERYLNPERVETVGLLDDSALRIFLETYRRESDSSRKFRMDGLLNHLIGLHYLFDRFGSAV